MSRAEICLSPQEIFAEYDKGDSYKQSIGKRGITEQGKINERFYVGDQWYGAKCGNNRPLVRRNIIKRIGEFKLSCISAAPLAVNYSAEGIPSGAAENSEEAYISGNGKSGIPDETEITTVMQAVSDYFKITAERVRLDMLKSEALLNCYISGTGILYTYWDSTVKTGLYADNGRTLPVTGDIACEVLNIENVVFGEPNRDDVQSQPYIIISRRRRTDEVIRDAERSNALREDIECIKPDNSRYLSNAGELGEREPEDSGRVTTMTKLYREWNKDGTDWKIMCTEVTENTVVRPPFDIGVSRYPIAKMSWQKRRSCIYGESEITYLIPNQIAINRCLSSAVWGILSTGMPITLVNGDTVTVPVTNEPGQIIKVYGSSEDVAGAIKHVQPPIFQSQYFTNINEMASSTLSDSGANDVVLGNIRPDNASAIIQMREAAMQPLQVYQNSFYDFIEQLARIWIDFWIRLYGKRRLKSVTRDGVKYIPFDGSRYKDLVINARIDVGASTLWSESVVISTLDNLLERKLITFEQYLDRLPTGLVPDITGLKEDLQLSLQTADGIEEPSDEDVLNDFALQQPELFEKYNRLSPEEQAKLMEKIKTVGGDSENAEAEL